MHKGVLVARSKFLLLLFSGYCCCCFFFCCVLDPIHYIFFALFFAVAASHYTILFICLFIYLVSLSSLKGWLSPGDKQVRFDSPRPSLLKPHSSSPVPKKGPFLRKKNTVGFIFLSPHNEFCFIAFLLSLFLVSILLVFSSRQVPVENCSRKSQSHFSGILGKFLRVNLHQNSQEY